MSVGNGLAIADIPVKACDAGVWNASAVLVE
jgi:hypothetical protein